MPLGAKPLVTLIVLENLTQLMHIMYKKCAKSLRVFCFLYSLRALLLDVDVQCAFLFVPPKININPLSLCHFYFGNIWFI